MRTNPDTGAIGAAFARPGMDTRVWLSFAVVTKVRYDPAGMLADLSLLPSGAEETCLIGSQFARPRSGSWRPIGVGDTIVVGYPDGDPMSGPVLITRIHVASDPPPEEFAAGTDVLESGNDAATDDMVDRVPDGATYRIVAKEGANVRIEVSGSGKVEVVSTGSSTVEVKSETAVIIDSPDARIGNGGGAKRIAGVGDLVTVVIPPMVVNVAGVPVPVPVVPATGLPTPTGAIVGVGQIMSGSSSAKAGA